MQQLVMPTRHVMLHRYQYDISWEGLYYDKCYCIFYGEKSINFSEICVSSCFSYTFVYHQYALTRERYTRLLLVGEESLDIPLRREKLTALALHYIKNVEYGKYHRDNTNLARDKR